MVFLGCLVGKWLSRSQISRLGSESQRGHLKEIGRKALWDAGRLTNSLLHYGGKNKCNFMHFSEVLWGFFLVISSDFIWFRLIYSARELYFTCPFIFAVQAPSHFQPVSTRAPLLPPPCTILSLSPHWCCYTGSWLAGPPAMLSYPRDFSHCNSGRAGALGSSINLLWTRCNWLSVWTMGHRLNSLLWESWAYLRSGSCKGAFVWGRHITKLSLS